VFVIVVVIIIIIYILYERQILVTRISRNFEVLINV
jgi:hypothetical protein